MSSPANDRSCCPGLVCGWGGVCRSGCRINGVVYQNGAKNPANGCQSCQPTVSTTVWSNLSGTACNDGDACTYGDRCVSGVCGGTAITCTGDACYTSTCNGTSSCTVTPLTGPSCDDGDACTYDDRCVSGACGGTAIACTGDVCSASACNGTSSCTVTPLTGPSCDDGDACTYDDQCTNGACGGTANTCTGDVCSASTCNGTSSCTVTPLTGPACDDGVQCTQADTCQEGVCVGVGPSCCNNPQWMPVSCTTQSWVWTSDRSVATDLATANALRVLQTGCRHGLPQPALGEGRCSLDGTGWVSTATFVMSGCSTSWAHIGVVSVCGGHDGDTYRHLVLGINDCYDY